MTKRDSLLGHASWRQALQVLNSRMMRPKYITADSTFLFSKAFEYGENKQPNAMRIKRRCN